MLRRLTGIALALALTAAGGAGAQESGPELLSRPWRAQPLAVVGGEAPGLGGQFREFDRIAWLSSGVLTFWGKTKEGWGMFSWRRDSLRFVTKNRARITASNGPSLRLVHDFPRTSAQSVAGRRMLYLRELSGFDQLPDVYGWDGERLVGVLAHNDTVFYQGLPHVVADVGQWNRNSDGSLTLEFTAKGRRRGYAVHDGERLRVVWLEGDDGVERWARGFRVFPGAAIGIVDRTLTAVTESGSESLFSPADSMTWQGSLAGAWGCHPDTFVTVSYREGTDVVGLAGGQSIALTGPWLTGVAAYTGGRVRTVLSDSAVVLDGKALGEHLFGDAVGCPAGRSEALLSAAWSRQGKDSTEAEAGLSEALAHLAGAEARLFRYVYRDAQVTPLIIPPADSLPDPPWPVIDRHGMFRLWGIRARSPFTTWSPIEYVIRDGFVGGDLQQLPREYHGVLWYFGSRFVALNSDPPVVQAAPTLQTDRGPVALGHVVGWRSATEAIAVREDGFYLLTRQ